MLKQLLGNERLRVVPDAARGFRIEGELSWPLGESEGRPVCRDEVVAGTRFVLSEGQRFELPWRWAA